MLDIRNEIAKVYDSYFSYIVENVPGQMIYPDFDYPALSAVDFSFWSYFHADQYAYMFENGLR